jgi:hypothetical protein
MNDQILTEAEIADLRCLAGMIIPPSAKYGVPGADDDTIFADIVSSIGRDADHMRAALARLRTLAGGPCAALDAVRRGEVAAKLRDEGGAPVGVLTRIVLLCYYRDDRVMVCRSAWSRGHPSLRATCSSRATGRCSTQFGPASPSGARRRRDRFSIVATRDRTTPCWGQNNRTSS